MATNLNFDDESVEEFNKEESIKGIVLADFQEVDLIDTISDADDRQDFLFCKEGDEVLYIPNTSSNGWVLGKSVKTDK